MTPPTAQDERARVIPEYRQAPAKVEPADAQARALSVGIIAATAARLRITYRSHGAGTVQWRALQLG